MSVRTVLSTRGSRAIFCGTYMYKGLFGCGRNLHRPVANQSTTSIIDKVWSQCVPLPQCNSHLLQKLREVFNIKKLSNEVLDKFGVRYTQLSIRRVSGYQSCIVFPLYDLDRETLIDMIFLTTNGRQLHGNFKNRLVTTAISLFGCHVKPVDTKKLVITDSEFDALAVYQASGLPAVCPLPAGSCLSDDHMRYIDQFDSIVLWSGRNGFKNQIPLQLATQMSPGKCCFVSPLEDSPLMRCGPLDAMNSEMDVKQLIGETLSLHNEKIMSFRQLCGSLYNEFLNGDQMAGISWRRFPLLTKILKGHRHGELTVFTGPTGSGKTTFLSELSLDLCLQGVPTLWGSFEIRNVRLARTMICQLAGFNVEDQMEEYSQWAKQLESLPLYFMNFHGSQNLTSVIETMTHAVYAYDIRHVVIDNLQFMISSQLIKHDRFLYQDMAISEFRRFATYHNVHVTLVIHPRKEEDDRELSMSSIFGSAKASQEADNVLILQVTKGRGSSKRIQVTKNRFDGNIGSFPLQFDSNSLRMSGFSSECERSDGVGKKRQYGHKLIERRTPHVEKVTDKRTVPHTMTGQSLQAATSGKLAQSMTPLSKKTNNHSKGTSRVQLDGENKNKAAG